jgi:hypothetical protein
MCRWGSTLRHAVMRLQSSQVLKMQGCSSGGDAISADTVVCTCALRTAPPIASESYNRLMDEAAAAPPALPGIRTSAAYRSTRRAVHGKASLQAAAQGPTSGALRQPTTTAPTPTRFTTMACRRPPARTTLSPTYSKFRHSLPTKMPAGNWHHVDYVFPAEDAATGEPATLGDGKRHVPLRLRHAAG